MNGFDRFYRVKTQGDVLTKTAARGLVDAATAAKVAFWRQSLDAAALDPDGTALGLAKQALAIWDGSHAAGVKTAASADDALPFVASFACAGVVDAAITKMAAAGELDATEAAKLAEINALAAFDDLEKVAFGIADLMRLVSQNPRVTGMVVGAAVGAGVGALNDRDNPARGAAAGATLGTAVGALGGQVATDFQQMGGLVPRT